MVGVVSCLESLKIGDTLFHMEDDNVLSMTMFFGLPNIIDCVWIKYNNDTHRVINLGHVSDYTYKEVRKSS